MQDTVEPEGLRKAPKYRLWKRNLEAAGCTVRKVELLCELNKRDGSLLFALLKTKVDDPDGRPLPHYTLIRGHAALIVTVVVNAETGARKFLMLRQRRSGNGFDSLEFPAGMLDGDVEDPVGVAVREVKEETGLDVRREDLIALSGPLYSSPGLDDEAIHFFACTVTLPPDRFHALEGGQTGMADEGEFIRTGLWDYEDAVKEVTSLQVRLAFSLYFEHSQKA